MEEIMRRVIFIALLCVFPLLGARRVMVCEDFTATWCTYCPGAARGLEELDEVAFDSVVVIAYHSSSSDPFYNQYSASRASYYGITGYPTVRLDGNYSIVGGLHTGTMYPAYRAYFDNRRNYESPANISLFLSYDSITRDGNLNIKIRNELSTSLSAQLHVALTESHIYYPWQGMDSLHSVLRLMLPDAQGEPINIPGGDSINRNRNFTLPGGIVDRNCEIIVFLQDNSTREILAGSRIALIGKPKVEFLRYSPSSIPQRGDTSDLTIYLGNYGSKDLANVRARLYSPVSYLQIIRDEANFGAIPIGGIAQSSSPYTINIQTGAPDTLVNLKLLVQSDDYTDSLTFPFLITERIGFSDDVESGTGGWRHYGINDNWRITTAQSHSPTHSWFSSYVNECDGYLVSPYFILGSPEISFWHRYATELDYDYVFFDVSAGNRWQNLEYWTGNSGGWVDQVYSLPSLVGTTMRIRFRFVSDYNVTDEGWFVDDIICGPSGLAEEKREERVLPRLMRAISPSAEMEIYSSEGRRVKDGVRKLSPGIYFLRLGKEKRMEKVVIIP
uniref:Omp28-related outer membrane protein n=1 Tax=candidate division WOR-3 bacterium TaxID=2052148 RepID=A0A7C3UP89_UNCW3